MLAAARWDSGSSRVATFPDHGDGVKIGIHHGGVTTSPDSVDRSTTAAEDAEVRGLLARFMPPAAGREVEKRVCLYTNTPDEHFLIDRHPADDRVLIVSPCSGHGFKFASAIGEVVAELVLDGGSAMDLSLFSLAARQTAQET